MAKAYLEAHEVDKLEKAATNLRDRLLIALLFRSSSRVSEALALEVDDIDFKKGTVTIRHLKVRTKLSCPECDLRLGKSHAFCPKCGAKVAEAVAEEATRRRMRTLPRWPRPSSWEKHSVRPYSASFGRSVTSKSACSGLSTCRRCPPG